MTDTITIDAGAVDVGYHLMAVQDWGGSQEWWRDWHTHLSRAGAEAVARDMVDADGLREVGTPEAWDDAEAKYSAKYGEHWHDLMSTNVCPGWEAIFVMPCPDTCQGDYCGELGTPFWTPARSAPRRHLHLA